MNKHYNGLLHLNIRCSKSDLPKIEKFYGEVMGLTNGYRPNFGNEGLWLYAGDEPIIHVGARVAEGFLSEKHNGSVDHFAFRMKGATEFREHVRKLGLKFEEQNVPEAGYQIFLRDPVGTVLEFNFPNAEAPEDIAKGTMAPRTRERAI
jgi:catechol 2,3-dioxygenase-like lactoylglutathione lyase family enzyme